MSFFEENSMEGIKGGSEITEGMCVAQQQQQQWLFHGMEWNIGKHELYEPSMLVPLLPGSLLLKRIGS